MPVRRVLAQADVGHHDEVAALGADGPHRLLDDAVLGVSLAALRVLGRRQPEEDHSADPETLHLARLARGLVGGEMEAAGEGGDLLADAFAGHDEQRIDQTLRREARLAHHGPQALATA